MKETGVSDAGDEFAEDSRAMPWGDCMATAWATGWLVALCDVLKAVRGSTWTPPTASEWVGLLAGSSAYVAVALAIAILLSLTLRLAMRNTRAAEFGVHAVPAITIAVLAAMATVANVSLTAGFAVSVVVLILGFTVQRAATARRALIWPASVSVAWAIGSGAALAAAVWTAQSYLIWNAKPTVALAGAALGAAFGGLLAYSVQRLVRAVRLRSYRGALYAPAAACAVAILWAAIVALPWLPAMGSPARPSLVLVTADSLSAAMCGFHQGQDHTPRLDAIAGTNAAVFNRAYALAPWTLPSMFGMFASRHPPGLTAGDSREGWKEEITLYRMPGDVQTLAQTLQAEGYDTAAFVGNSLLRDPQGILRGFQRHIVTGHRTHSRESLLSNFPTLEILCLQAGAPFVRERPIDSTRVLTAQATTYIRQHSGRPYFLWVHLMDPHTAYAPPLSDAVRNWHWQIFCNADPYWGTPQTDEHGVLLFDPSAGSSETQKQNIAGLYREEVSYIDTAAARIHAALPQDPSKTGAYFCFTSDHGEELWEHNQFGHGQSLYDELVRVPLLITGPSIRPTRVEDPVSAIDLMPTLAGLLNTPAPAEWLGHNLAPALQSDDLLTPSPVIARGTNLYSQGGPLSMIVKGPLKLIRDHESNTHTMYNWRDDPKEAVELLQGLAPPPGLAAELDFFDRVAPYSVRQLFDNGSDSSISDELDAQMRGMGYIH